MADNLPQRAKISKPEDRDLVAAILVKEGYTVRQTREKIGKDTKWTYYVEFWVGGPH